MLSTSPSFVEKFLVASVELLVVLRWSDMGSVVPSWGPPGPWFVNPTNQVYILTLVKIYAFYFI